MSEHECMTITQFRKKYGIRSDNRLHQVVYDAAKRRGEWRGLQLHEFREPGSRISSYPARELLAIAQKLGLVITCQMPMSKRLETIAEEYLTCKAFRQVFPELPRNFSSRTMAKANQLMRRGEKVVIQEPGKQCLFKKEFLVTIAENFGMNFTPEKSTEQEHEATTQEPADTQQEPTLLAVVLDCRRILQELLDTWKGDKQ